MPTAQTQTRPSTGSGTPSSDIFIARQPIFDMNQEVFAYELLFRSSRENTAILSDGNEASSQLINNALHLLGLNQVIGRQRGFVNFTRQLLLDESYTILPPQTLVVELLEDIEPDEPIVEACRKAKAAGYTVALDDYTFDPRYEPLLNLADIIKVDFMQTTRAKRAELSAKLKDRGVALLAEKVETTAEADEARGLGYSYLQGYFFCKPQVITGRDIRAVKHNYLAFLQEINRDELDFDALENVIKRDTSLSLKLLRYLNSAGMGVRNKVTSIRQAIALLGEGPLRKWGSLVALTGLGGDKPNELMVTCLVRGRFCEQLAGPLKLAGQELQLFLIGLLSGLDALLDRPLCDVLMDVPVDDAVRQPLLKGEGELAKVYQLVRASERGNWRRVSQLADQLNLPMEKVAGTYREALGWADEVFEMSA